MTTTNEATATPTPQVNPLVQRIRKCSQQIGFLLQRYNEIKFGWVRFRVRYLEEGEWKVFRNIFRDPQEAYAFLQEAQKRMTGIQMKVISENIEPQIRIVSDPEILTISDQNNPGRVSNPLLHALVKMREIDKQTAITFEQINKVGVVRSLGVDARLECSALIQLARKLAAQFTYLLECKVLYSEDIKAKYSELLIDLNTARGIADRLVRTLGDRRGYLGVHEFHQQVGELLRLAEIIKTSSLQLADYHEEFATGRVGSPVEFGEGIKYVLEGEEEKPKRPSPQTESESES